MNNARAVWLTAMLASAVAGCSGDSLADARRYTDSGDSYVARQQDAEAIIEYGRALQLTPDAADTRFKLAQALERRGESKKAFDEYLATADQQPSNVAAQMKVGSALLAAGEFPSARYRAELVLQADPSYAPGYVLLGSALAGLRDVQSAQKQFEHALSLDPTSAPAWTALGAARQAGGGDREAAAAFEKAIAADPSSAHAHVAAGSFYWASGDLRRAEEALQRAVAADPSNQDARGTLALLYMATDRAPLAEPHLRAVAVDATGQFVLAEYLASASRHDEAVAVLETLEAHEDKTVARTARLRRAAALHAAGKRTEAHQLLDASLEEGDDRHKATVHVASARLLLNEGRSTDALRHATTAVSMKTSAPAARYVLGLASLQAGNLEAAARAFNEVARADPRSAEAVVQLARVRLAQDDLGGAVTAAFEAVERDPRSADARALLVRSLREQGQIERARRELERASALAVQTPALTLERGWLALARGDSGAARSSFTEVLSTPSVIHDAQGGVVAVDLAEQKFAQARARVAAWRRTPHSNPRLPLLAAQIEIAAGAMDAAARYGQEALGHERTTAEARELLGRILVAQDKHDEALVQYEQLARHSARDAARAYTMIGLLHEERGDPGAARAAYERALTANPRAAVAANNLAWIHTQPGGDLDEALRLAQTADDEMRRPESAHTLGWVYFQLGRHAEALTRFESARRRVPTNATYHYHAGMTYAKTGDHGRAVEALQRALALDPKLAAARELFRDIQSKQESPLSE